jgi:hypothetical protein
MIISSPSTLPGPQLKDTMDRQHASEIVFGTDLPGDDLTITTLNPGVAKSGYFIFDVPDDARGLDLILRGGVRSGEKAIAAFIGSSFEELAGQGRPETPSRLPFSS